MSIKNRKLMMVATILVIVSGVIAAVLFSGEKFQTRRTPRREFNRFISTPSWEEIQEVGRLERMFGRRVFADGKITLTKPYDEKSLSILLSAFDSDPTIRMFAARLVFLVVEQLDLPEQALEKISRKIKPLAEEEIKDIRDLDLHGLERDHYIEQREAVLAARRTLWQIGLKKMSDQQKLAFFRDQLLGEEAAEVDSHIRIKILEYLSEMPFQEAKAILEESLVSKRTRRLGRDRISRAIQKIKVSRRLKTFSPAAKNQELNKVLEESPDLSMRIWAIREIGKVRDDTAISKLQSIFDGEEYEYRLRLEAQEALKDLGVLPKDVYRFAIEY